MKVDNILSRRSEMMNTTIESEPIVLSSRIRLARNINELPFPGWAKKNELQQILNTCHKAICEIPRFKKAAIIDIKDLTEVQRQILIERYIISSDLCNTESAGVAISNDQAISLMINEEDHMRLQIMRKGFNFNKIWKSIDRIDSDIETHTDYAFSTELGYLTACPTNVGTGMRASVMMHLPGLVMSGNMEKVIKAVNKLGIAVRGSFGEGSEAVGSIFQVSNQQTLGESEQTILGKLSSVLKSIIDQENNAREVILEDNRQQLLDKIGRSYGILNNARILSSGESLNMLSLMRLASDIGFLKSEARAEIDCLFIESQPGHIQLLAGSVIDSTVRDELRAKFIREKMQIIGPLTF